MIGNAVRVLRERQGLSQVGLAERLGMNPVQLCNIEKGNVTPRSMTIVRIARALGVTEEAIITFSEGRSSGLIPVRRATAVLRDVCEEAARLNCGVENLLRKRDVPVATTLPFHHAYLLQDHSSEILAGALRDALLVGRAAISDLVWTLEFANVHVHLLPLPKDAPSAAWWNQALEALTIIVDKASTPERQTYRLAYELGAACLFRSQGDRPVRETVREHRFLTEFAADFLMPAVAVADMVVKCGIAPNDWTFEQLLSFKAHFGVSAEAFAFRLEELGLIAKPLRLKLRDRLRAYYRQHPKAMEPEPCLAVLETGRRWEMFECV